MALILKSNAKYQGSGTLESAVDISMSSQEIYDEYADRVSADGGAIMDSAATLSAITWAKERRIAGKSFAISAAWGVKKDGSNNIVKVYGFNGVDFVTLSPYAPITHGTNASGDYAFFYPVSGVSSLVSERKVRAAYGKRFAIGATAKHADTGPNRRMAFCFQDIENKSRFESTLFLSKNGAAPSTIHTYYSDDSIFNRNFSAPYADYRGEVGLIDPLAGLTTFRNGLVLGSTVVASGKQVSDSSDVEGLVSVGLYWAAGAWTGFTGGGSELLEVWFINDATADDCLSLSSRLDKSV